MMKMNFSRALLVTAVAGALSVSDMGCSPTLTEQPDFVSPGSFYRNNSDLTAALNGAYRELNGEWFNTFYNRSVFDCALGIQSGYEKGPQYYKQGGYVASDDYIGSYWAQNYRGINRANAVIARAPGAAETSNEATAGVKKQIVAEAKFLRAMYYYQLYVFFENVPVRDKPTEELGNYEGNEGGNQKALELMIADLKAAETDLPAAFTGADMGRPTKWAAKTLLAKVYLEQGTYQAAADKAKEVIDQSGLTLYPDFSFAFDVAHENMNERLFEIQNSFSKSATQIYNNMHAHFTPTDWDGGDPQLLSAGNGTTAAGWADAWIVGAIPFRESFETGDKRVPVTFMTQYRSKNAGGAVVQYSKDAKSQFVASGSPERTFNNVIIQKVIEPNLPNWDRTEKNFVLLRLSDAYLAHSEAVNAGATGDAYVGINAVRARAGLAPLAGLDKAAMREAVFNEWMHEFAGEGWAFAHARRFNKTAELISKYAGRTVSNDRYRVLPLPFVEVNANPNVKQNTGW
ncbi:RagB/SusD family nutrient uptake outer membrane protein [Spirosoma arcticum]